jgi:hypothetical protein
VPGRWQRRRPRGRTRLMEREALAERCDGA